MVQLKTLISFFRMNQRVPIGLGLQLSRDKKPFNSALSDSGSSTHYPAKADRQRRYLAVWQT